jgi:hypothetical protein
MRLSVSLSRPVLRPPANQARALLTLVLAAARTHDAAERRKMAEAAVAMMHAARDEQLVCV